jgi:hypothetical protein
MMKINVPDDAFHARVADDDILRGRLDPPCRLREVYL